MVQELFYLSRNHLQFDYISTKNELKVFDKLNSILETFYAFVCSYKHFLVGKFVTEMRCLRDSSNNLEMWYTFNLKIYVQKSA